MSVHSQQQKLAEGSRIQDFAQPSYNPEPIPANFSWLNILRFGSYPHKPSVPSQGNEHRRLSVREEPRLGEDPQDV